ncbi:MAG: FtsX-like permease family protein, partial [Balneolaceae bacterium]|nr:FtsX-like permease family protein [Balneolaceae bacterium]
IILTESTAEKYFGNENPVGKTITINNQDNEVAGVMQDIPRNSHMKFDFLASTTNLGFIQQPNYTGFSSYTYLELVDGATMEQVEAKIPRVVERYASGQIERELGLSYEEYTAAGNGYNYFLQPIGDIHLHSNLESEIKPNGNITYVYILSSIALFILIIAGINFVNLATARSADRAREVGIRKVMGSQRSQLIRQFLSESAFISLVSLVIAVGIIQIVLPLFNNLAGKQLSTALFTTGWTPFVLIGFALLVGLLAGLYPAFYISSLQPVNVLKGKLQSTSKGLWLRNGLVVFQFAISIILISGTLVVFNQMEFIQNTRLGFDKENILVIDRAGNVEQLEAFKDELRRVPGVVDVAGASTVPGGIFFGIQFQQQGGADVLTTKGFSADDHFFDTMNMNMVEGRAFSEDFNDSLSIILNQTAVQSLGIEDPIGLTLQSNVNIDNENITVPFRVVGVVEDFNFESLRAPITPLAILSAEGPQGFQNQLTVRFTSQNIQETIAQIENTWKEFAPESIFSYSFLDNDLAAQYEAEQRAGNIFGVFAIVAIVIACVGLFGLAAYMAFQRTKEIGVRKVLGATVPNIILLLSKDFTKLVGIAFVIALPVAWLLMQNWLENFAYRIDLSLITFVIAGIITLIIACITVSYQAVSAALMNPVNSLRSE